MASRVGELARKSVAGAVSTIASHTDSYVIQPSHEALRMCKALRPEYAVVPAITYSFAGISLPKVFPRDAKENFEDVLAKLARLATAVAELNANGVTHGDITFNNVMSHTGNGAYVLIDFGFDLPADYTLFAEYYQSVLAAGGSVYQDWKLPRRTTTLLSQATQPCSLQIGIRCTT